MKNFQQEGWGVNKIEAALRYAEAGWFVFPVHTPTGDPSKPCSCRRVTCTRIGKHPCHQNACKNRGKHSCHRTVCDSIGKHPRTKNGVKDAITDEKQIRQWWHTWEDANIGVATGKESGFFVLDVDPRSGGDKALACLEAKHGKLPETRTADTGGGGVHYLFRYPDFPVKNSTRGLGPGLDIKSDGGAIVVAPSLHAGGARYRWRNGAAVADAPEWLLLLLREAQKSRANGSAEIGGTIPEGRRNNTLTSWAGTMRRRGMEAAEIEAALLVANNKRCIPPLAEDEVRKIAASVCKYEPADRVTYR